MVVHCYSGTVWCPARQMGTAQSTARSAPRSTPSMILETRRWPPLALCIVDSVQSTGVTYTSVGNVLDAYRRYRIERNGSPKTDGTRELLKTFEEVNGSAGWAAAIGNQNKTSTRAGAPLKAEAIRLAAEVLDRAEITNTAKLRAAADKPELGAVKSQWPGAQTPNRSRSTFTALRLRFGVRSFPPRSP